MTYFNFSLYKSKQCFLYVLHKVTYILAIGNMAALSEEVSHSCWVGACTWGPIRQCKVLFKWIKQHDTSVLNKPRWLCVKSRATHNLGFRRPCISSEVQNNRISSYLWCACNLSQRTSHAETSCTCGVVVVVSNFWLPNAVAELIWDRVPFLPWNCMGFPHTKGWERFLPFTPELV